MGQAMDDFRKGFRKATGADEEEEKKNKGSEEEGQGAYQTAKEMLGMAAEGSVDMVRDAADYLGLRKKKK